jgi:hypothetical protein
MSLEVSQNLNNELSDLPTKILIHGDFWNEHQSENTITSFSQSDVEQIFSPIDLDITRSLNGRASY